MAHQEAPEAVDAPVEYTTDSAAAALKEAFAAEEAPEEVEETDDTVEASEEAGEEEITDADLEESEGEEADESDEPDAPAIEAPVSLNADEKAVFSQLPPEAQAAWAASEDRRNKQVQEATTKASEAQRQAAANADRQAREQYLAQLDQVLEAFKPQEPPEQLAYSNPQAYAQQMAAYREAQGEFTQFAEQITAIKSEAAEQERAQFVQQRDAELMQIPEIANEETRKGYLDKAFEAGESLGYTRQELAETMTARDVKAMAAYAEAKAKADKWDASNKKQMERVRAAKNRTLKPGAAQPKGSSNRAFDQAQQRLKASGSVDDAAAAFKAIL